MRQLFIFAESLCQRSVYADIMAENMQAAHAVVWPKHVAEVLSVRSNLQFDLE